MRTGDQVPHECKAEQKDESQVFEMNFLNKKGYNFALTVILSELLPVFNAIFPQEFSYGCTVHQLELQQAQLLTDPALVPQTSVICVIPSITAQLWSSLPTGALPKTEELCCNWATAGKVLPVRKTYLPLSANLSKCLKNHVPKF